MLPSVKLPVYRVDTEHPIDHESDVVGRDGHLVRNRQRLLRHTVEDKGFVVFHEKKLTPNAFQR